MEEAPRINVGSLDSLGLEGCHSFVANGLDGLVLWVQGSLPFLTIAALPVDGKFVVGHAPFPTVANGIAAGTIGSDDGHVAEENFMPASSLAAHFPATHQRSGGRQLRFQFLRGHEWEARPQFVTRGVHVPVPIAPKRRAAWDDRRAARVDDDIGVLKGMSWRRYVSVDRCAKAGEILGQPLGETAGSAGVAGVQHDDDAGAALGTKGVGQGGGSLAAADIGRPQGVGVAVAKIGENIPAAGLVLNQFQEPLGIGGSAVLGILEAHPRR